MDTSVLVVDDDAIIRELLDRFLSGRGYSVKTLADASALSEHLAKNRPAVVVLDIMMPGTDGLHALAGLRSTGDTVPVICISGRGTVGDRVVALELGADDYVVKPFEPRELMARINSVSRRDTYPAALPMPMPTEEGGGIFTFGRLRFDSVARRLFVDGKPLRMRESEVTLLRIFVRAPYRVLTKEYLHGQLRDDATSFRERGLDVAMFRLRQLVEDEPSNPRHLQTVRGKGYVFVPNGAARS